jgi:hypothetical protein
MSSSTWFDARSLRNAETHHTCKHFIFLIQYVKCQYYLCKQGQRSRHSDWLQAGWLRGQSLGPSEGKISLLSIPSRPVLVPTHPPIQWVLQALFSGVKWQRHEADHSPQSSAEVKNTWSYNSTPPHVFMACA